MILLQGAMSMEIEYLISILEQAEKREINGYVFYRGIMGGIDTLVGKTEVGSVNSALATLTAINEFNPKAVINQGLAGAHLNEMKQDDIIIGSSCVNLNLLITPREKSGGGSDSLKWEFLSEGGREICADIELTEMFKNSSYKFGEKYIGKLGSGDIFSREADRINKIRELNQTLGEDMESFAVYKVCEMMKIPCISVRIISNNELSGLDYNESSSQTEKTVQILQKYVAETVCGNKNQFN